MCTMRECRQTGGLFSIILSMIVKIGKDIATTNRLAVMSTEEPDTLNIMRETQNRNDEVLERIADEDFEETTKRY